MTIAQFTKTIISDNWPYLLIGLIGTSLIVVDIIKWAKWKLWNKSIMKKIYKPKVYKLIISPYYASYSLFSKLAGNDTDDWKMMANAASGKDTIKMIVEKEVEKIFETYDYELSKISNEVVNQ